jgi:hypothetical protein
MRIRRGRWSCGSFAVALAAISIVGCAPANQQPPVAYQRGYDAGHGAHVLRLIKQDGELPIMACSDSQQSDKLGQNYSFDDAAVYRQGCLDAVRDQGISPSAGF